jgi:3-isopropylmalate dehydrogenase
MCHVGVLAGEGVGPEVVAAAREVLSVVEARTRQRFRFSDGGTIGLEAAARHGAELTREVEDFCRAVFADRGVILAGPGGGRFVYDLRARFSLHYKLVPLRPLQVTPAMGPLRAECTRGVDVVVVRENVGGLYFGQWGREETKGGTFTYHKFGYRPEEVDRVIETAVRIAQGRRRRLTLVVKRAGVPAISELWEQRLAVAGAHGRVECEMLEIDNAVYQLISAPHRFDVIVTTNMFGDVLADCGALLLGGRGMSYSGNFDGQGAAVYQTGHGAAADIAGTDRANPVGQIMSVAMMLRESLGLPDAAAAIEAAAQSVLSEGFRTFDIQAPGCTVVGTSELGARIAGCVDALLAAPPAS